MLRRARNAAAGTASVRPASIRTSTDGHTIGSAPVDGPFGRTFTFADPDGYQITLHDRA